MSELVHGFTVYMALSVSDGLEPVHGYVPPEQQRQGKARGVSATVWLCRETEETESWEFTGSTS